LSLARRPHLKQAQRRNHPLRSSPLYHRYWSRRQELQSPHRRSGMKILRARSPPQFQ